MAYTRSYQMDQRARYDATNYNGQVTPAIATVLFTAARSGSSVPKFRSVIKSHGNATSPFSATFLNLRELSHMSRTIVHANLAVPTQPFRESIAGYLIDQLPSFSAVDTSEVDAQALTLAFKALDREQSHSSGLQFLGELPETIRMLRRPFSGLTAYANHYIARASQLQRKYRVARTPRARQGLRKTLADTWLEFSFGIRPLISDVKDLAETAARLSSDTRRSRLQARASRPASGSVTSLATGTSTNYILLRKDVRETVLHTAQYLVFCDWSASSALGSMSRLVELSGFRLDKFVPTMYELAPWSFLIDYWSNLGTVIETGCSAQNGVAFVVKTIRIVSKRELFYDGISSSGAPPQLSSLGKGGHSSLIRSSVVRSLEGSKLPTVPFKFDLPGRATQWENMVALFVSKRRLS
jgi:hypothetical protein